MFSRTLAVCENASISARSCAVRFSSAAGSVSSSRVRLPPIVFHDLRRTAATLLKDLGVPARDAQVILGYSHVSVTLGIYSEVFDTQINTGLQHMNRALRGGGPTQSR